MVGLYYFRGKIKKMNFEVSGKIVELWPAQQVTERFRKREFVVEVMDGQYAQFLKMQFNQEKCELLDSFGKDDEVTVSFNITGRPSQGRNGETQYYNNLVAWRILPSSGGGKAPVGSSQSATSFPEKSSLPTAGVGDDLPF